MAINDNAMSIHEHGHRAFVGGDGEYWDTLSRLQFDFLVAHGLKPHHRFIDIGCGALRGGRRFIEYLDPGRYHGIDKHIELIIYGVNDELGSEMFRAKRPHFVVSDRFEFERFGRVFRFGLAQSLFSHLTLADIDRCLARLAAVTDRGCRLYATFYEVDRPRENAPTSHSIAGFSYTSTELGLVARKSSWTSHYIGEWGHPRGQKMIELVRD